MGSKGVRLAVNLLAAFVAIVLLGGVSVLAAIGSLGASDSCGGCDATPAWASLGMTTSMVLLVVWAVAAAVLAVRRFRPHR